MWFDLNRSLLTRTFIHLDAIVYPALWLDRTRLVSNVLGRLFFEPGVLPLLPALILLVLVAGLTDALPANLAVFVWARRD